MKLTRTELLLIFLVIFGAAIRLYGLGDDGLHVDEKFTVDLISHDFWYVLTFALSKDCNPPIYYIAAWISTQLFGITAFAERLPAAIAGIALIPASYYLGKEYRNELVGILTASVVTILGSMWYYSQFGRAYSMICLFFTISLIFYLRILKGDSNPKTFLYFGLMSSVCVWTHLFALIPLAFMGAYLAWEYDLFDQVNWYFVGLSPTVLMAGTFWAIHTEREAIMKGWFGNTIQQLLNYMPLEYFGYAFALMFGLILVAVYLNRTDDLTVAMGYVWVFSFTSQLVISLITPVFIRYTLLLVPMLVMLAMEPVATFIKNHSDNPLQRNFTLGVFAAMFIAIQIYQAFTLYYLPNGSITL